MSPSQESEVTTRVPVSDDVVNDSKGPDAPAADSEDSGFAVLSTLSTFHKALLLVIFCLSFFLDSLNNAALFSAIPIISDELSIPNSEGVWMLSAYKIAFAALLLVSGRVSDLYNPKWAFVSGAGIMTVFSLGDGYVHGKIPLLVLRGFAGAGAALTTPSAQHLIVHIYPDPREQARALGLFGALGATGNVLGLVIGALFIQYVSWKWVFFFSAIMTGLVAVAGTILIPNIRRKSEYSHWMRFRRLDLIGLTLFAIAAILFIFAVTSGSVDGWGSATVIAPLVLSVVLIVGFSLWEAWIPEYYAALPPRVWGYQNFGILIAVAFTPIFWSSSCFLLFSWNWQLVYGWSPLEAAKHLLPPGLMVFPVLPFATLLQFKIRMKWVLLIGLVTMVVGTIVLTFATSPDRYWRFAFPGFIVGAIGMTVLYVSANIAILAATPPEMAGVVSAVFACAVQTGSAAGTSVVTSIQTSVQKTHGGPDSFQGCAAGLWFLAAFVGIVTLLFLVFMKDTLGPSAPPPHLGAGSNDPKAGSHPQNHDVPADIEKVAVDSDVNLAVV